MKNEIKWICQAKAVILYRFKLSELIIFVGETLILISSLTIKQLSKHISNLEFLGDEVLNQKQLKASELNEANETNDWQIYENRKKAVEL